MAGGVGIVMSHELLVSVSVFGRKWIVTFGVISVSAETEIPLSVDLYLTWRPKRPDTMADTVIAKCVQNR